MDRDLLWINKDATSGTLRSFSSRQEEKKIRRHVQERHHRPAAHLCLFPQAPVVPSLIAHSLPPSPSCAIPELEDMERRSLMFFRSRTARECVGWTDASFWNGLVLQVSHISKVVAHTLISIAAVHESLQLPANHAARARLRTFSYAQCNKALAAAQHSTPAYFEALISCIAMICLLSLRNDKKEAVRFLWSGKMILQEWRSKSCVSATVGMTACEAKLAAGDLEPIFHRLEARLCSMGDPILAFRHSLSPPTCTESTKMSVFQPKIPAKFRTLAEARDCLSTILAWARTRSLTGALGNALSESFRRSFCHLCSLWRMALDVTGDSTADQDFRQTNRERLCLVIAQLFGRILVACVSYNTESVYDEHLPAFREIVQTVEEIHKTYDVDTTANTSLGVDGGFISILTFVGQKCRDPTVRRRAMDLLYRRQRQEGDQHGWMGGKITEVIMKLEEAGNTVCSCFDIPESSRRRIYAGHQYQNQGKLRLFFVRYPYDPSIEGTDDEEEISFPGFATEKLGDRQADVAAPDLIFGSGFTDVKVNGNGRNYYRLQMGDYIFPIPRV